MDSAVQAICPGCKRILRVPAEWIGRSMRCKFCHNVVQAQLKAGPPAYPQNPVTPAPAVAPPHPAVGPVPTAASHVPASPSNGYAYPAAAHPAPQGDQPFAGYAPEAYAPAFETAGSRHRGRGKYRGPRGGSAGKWVAVGLAFVLVAGMVAVVLVKPDLFGKKDSAVNKDEPPVEVVAKVTPEGPAAAVASGPFPRRMLAVSVSNYLFANPIQYGDSRAAKEAERHDVHTVVGRFCDRWRIPRDQVYEITDGPLADAAGKAGKTPLTSPPPLKEVIEKTLATFCDGSRSQDRVVFLFAGHATEKDGQAYLVPVEGELDDPASLIPVKEVYAKLGQCKAQEKLAIFDVCRFDSGRGTERPAFGAMTEGLEKALHTAPADVNVWTSCSQGEYSYELDFAFDGKVEAWGSFFMSQFLNASAAGAFSKTGKKTGGGIQSPEDPLPIKPLVDFVNQSTEEMARVVEQGKKQHPKFTAASRSRQVPYDPNEPAVARFEIPGANRGADRAAVAAILDEIRLPPIKSIRKDVPEQKLDGSFAFTADALKDYLDDSVRPAEVKKNPEKYPLRAAVIEAVGELRKLQEEGGGDELPEEFRGKTGDDAKKQILGIQRIPAAREAILNDLKGKLEAVAEMKEREKSKRWQAHYDYVLAEVKLRLAYISEYNLALGKVRKDELPPLDDSKKHRGWRLAASEKMKSPKEIRDLVEEARSTLTDLVKNHPHTPWSMLAKRERFTALGLEWQASSFGE